MLISKSFKSILLLFNTVYKSDSSGEPSKLKALKLGESGDDAPAPYLTWDFFELGNFLYLDTFVYLKKIFKLCPDVFSMIGQLLMHGDDYYK